MSRSSRESLACTPFGLRQVRATVSRDGPSPPDSGRSRGIIQLSVNFPRGEASPMTEVGFRPDESPRTPRRASPCRVCVLPVQECAHQALCPLRFRLLPYRRPCSAEWPLHPRRAKKDNSLVQQSRIKGSHFLFFAFMCPTAGGHLPLLARGVLRGVRMRG